MSHGIPNSQTISTHSESYSPLNNMIKSGRMNFQYLNDNIHVLIPLVSYLCGLNTEACAR